MDLLKQAICNEQRLALKRWEELNEMINRNEKVDRNEYVNLRLKIQDLDHRLEVIASQEVA